MGIFTLGKKPKETEEELNRQLGLTTDKETMLKKIDAATNLEDVISIFGECAQEYRNKYVDNELRISNIKDIAYLNDEVWHYMQSNNHELFSFNIPKLHLHLFLAHNATKTCVF